MINGNVDLEDSEFDVRYVCDEGQELVYLRDDNLGDPVYICGESLFYSNTLPSDYLPTMGTCLRPGMAR